MVIEILLSLFLSPALAQPQAEYSQQDAEAVRETKGFLTNRDRRNNYIKKNKDAQEADSYANKLMSGDQKNMDELYSISAEVMEIIVKKAKGDATVMQKMMLEFQANPEALYAEMTPAQRARIKALSQKVRKPANQQR